VFHFAGPSGDQIADERTKVFGHKDDARSLVLDVRRGGPLGPPGPT
jgi:hypothetical protein